MKQEDKRADHYWSTPISLPRIMETLVIMPYRQDKAQGNEIKLSLEGWKNNCKFDYHFAVIGEFNEDLKEEFPWVDFIYCKTKEEVEDQYNPHLDIQHKMEVGMEMFGDRYDGFIEMLDDAYAVRPFNLEDIQCVHYHKLPFIDEKFAPKSFWVYDKWKTRKLLNDNGFPQIDYTAHIPVYYEFKKLKEIWDRFNMRNESYVLEDLYFNYFKHDEEKADTDILIGIWNKRSREENIKQVYDNHNIKFVCNGFLGHSKELENDITKLIEIKKIKKNEIH